MANNIFEKDHKILYNSVPDQRLTYANQLTVKNWNDIINILKVQANINADYLEKLHTWFIGNYDPTKSFEENIVSIPEDKNFAEYILELIKAAESELKRLNQIKADTQYVDVADEEISRRIDQVEQTKADVDYVDGELSTLTDYVDGELSTLTDYVNDLYLIKADTQYVDVQDEELSRRIDQNDLYISANTQNVERLIEHVTSINNSITSLTNRVGDVEKEKADTQYVDEKFDQILGEGATETLDTIAEISKALEEHNDEYDSLLAVVGNKADKNEVPTKLSDLKIDIEVGGVDEEEVMEIVEENGEEVEDIELLETEDIDLLEIQAEYSIGTSSNYDETNDNQLVTAKAVKSIVDAVANVLQVNIDDKADKTSIPTTLSQLNNDSNFITNAVSTLKNYYNKTEVNDLINAIPTMNLLVVSTLPTTDINTNTIYLVPYENEYEEYVYINNRWEMLGTTKINISEYATKAYVDSKIESSITSALEGDY